jgi:hypothetical protein
MGSVPDDPHPSRPKRLGSRSGVDDAVAWVLAERPGQPGYTEAQISLHLMNHLRSMSIAGPEEIAQWAADAARELNTSVTHVFSRWLPTLRQRGILGPDSGRGRRRHHERYVWLLLFLAEWRALPRRDRPAGGMWPFLYARLQEADPDLTRDLEEYESLQSWYFSYKRTRS